MRRVGLTFLPVIVTLVLLPLIAFASAPDPAWITGIYDGVDGDDIVTMVDDIAGLDLELPSALSQLHCSFHQGLVSRSEISSAFSSGPTSRGPARPSALISLHTAAASRKSCQVPVAAALLRETSSDHSGAPSPARPLRESASVLGSQLANSDQRRKSHEVNRVCALHSDCSKGPLTGREADGYWRLMTALGGPA